MRPTSLFLLVTALAACGGDERTPKTQDDAADSTESGGDSSPAGDSEAVVAEGEDNAHAGGLPTKCARQDGEVCVPPEKFVLALCNHDYPTVALSLFASGTPWTRAYLLAETRAVNASGGGSSNDMLKVDEEVLVLRKRGASTPGGMVVSGAEGSYDVLRWDGACVTVSPGEISFDAPAKIGNARIIWSNLEIAVRDQLKENESVYDAYVQHKKTCKGVTFGKVSKECVKADGELSRVIAEHVRSQGAPKPKKLPEL